jgi:hypothetical protein
VISFTVEPASYLITMTARKVMINKLDCNEVYVNRVNGFWTITAKGSLSEIRLIHES